MQVEQSQNVHATYKVRPEALSEQVVVVVVEVAMSHEVSHLELWAVYSIG